LTISTGTIAIVVFPKYFFTEVVNRYNREMTNNENRTYPMVLSPVIEIYKIVLRRAYERNTIAKIRAEFFLLRNPYGMMINDSIVRSTSIHIRMLSWENVRNVGRSPVISVLPRAKKNTASRTMIKKTNIRIPVEASFRSFIKKIHTSGRLIFFHSHDITTIT